MVFIDLHSTKWVASRVPQNDDKNDDGDDDSVIIIEIRRRQDFGEEHESCAEALNRRHCAIRGRLIEAACLLLRGCNFKKIKIIY
jgi:hypothetical protein